METFISNSGKKFIILSQNGDKCVIQFLESGSTREANIHNIRAGKVRDLYAISVYGAGYYGDFEKVPYWKQAKQLWQNMVKRCYYEKDKKGYFGRVTVSTPWLCFATFLKDIKTLPNFEKWLDHKNGRGPAYNLDKDLKIPGCKIYSKETCSFVTEYENKAAGARNGKPYTKKQRVGKN